MIAYRCSNTFVKGTMDLLLSLRLAHIVVGRAALELMRRPRRDQFKVSIVRAAELDAVACMSLPAERYIHVADNLFQYLTCRRPHF
jgi:hypothetical protein